VLYRWHPQRDIIALGAALTLATLPPAVQLSFHFYRANSMPFSAMLALMLLIIAWRNASLRDAVLTGLALGLASMVYLAGLFVPLALFIVALIELLRDDKFTKRIVQGVVIAVSFGVSMLGWLYYYLRIPDWLLRVNSLSEEASPLSQPDLFPAYLWTTASTVFMPSTVHDMRYAPFTTGFLNPVLLGLFAIGIAVTLWRWRERWVFAPLILGVVMLLPNALSSEPYQPVRMVGTFGALALLVGLGAGEVYQWVHKRDSLRVIGGSLLLAIAVGTPVYTTYHLWYHYYQQPLVTVPEAARSHALHYRVGYQDMLEQIAVADIPTYLPLVHLNTDLAAATLRPQYFPTVTPYDGRELPAGQVVRPVGEVIYGFFAYGLYPPVQYGLLLPDSGEIIILPPLAIDTAEQLFDAVRDEGEIYTNELGWALGWRDMVTETDNPFADLRVPEVDTVLATFDDMLELVAVEANETLGTGDYMPITLYWRVREAGTPDYFSRLQVWDSANSSFGAEGTALSVIGSADFPLNIHYNIYPTVMWEVGEIVPDTRWVRIADDTPAGAYRFAVSVLGYPGLFPVGNTSPRFEAWSLVGRSAVNPVVGDFMVASTPPETELRLGDLYELVNYEASIALDELNAGDTFNVDVTWYVHETTQVDYITAVHVLDDTGALVTQQDVQGLQGLFPTWAWQDGHTITLSYTLTIPDNAQAPFTVQTLMYDFDGLVRLPATEDDEALANDVIVLE
ncbi:MAG: hypothetical protein AAF126_16075, partial [Chloroflexota bacterium]